MTTELTKKNKQQVIANDFSDHLLTWFDQFGRKDLPWQHPVDAYRVWLSEIMLQQTQVTTVVPYFEKFITAFPTVESLANADSDQVMHLWSGLGYYARARNLHRTAQIVTEQFNGQFPDDVETLATLPGIGRSTAGAIASIAFGKRAAILDGNVKRVLTRVFAVEGWPGLTSVSQKLWLLAQQLTPHERNADYTQAIMDLGATVCTRTRPRCAICPMQDICTGLQTGNPTAFPTRKPKKSIPTRQTKMLLIMNNDDCVLLYKRPSTGIWGGLWSLPECNIDEDPKQISQTQFNCVISKVSTGITFRHTFSHFHLDITPITLKAKKWPSKLLATDFYWHHPSKAAPGGLAAPVSRILESLSKAI